MTSKTEDMVAALRVAAKKDAAAAYDAGLQTGSEARASKQQLQEQFNTGVQELLSGKRQSMQSFRALKAEFREKGLDEDSMDITPPQPNWRGHVLGDGPPENR